MEKIKIGIIGGSGVDQIPGIKNVSKIEVKTPFGAPSDCLTVGAVENIPVAFLPRHGEGHRISPTQINVRANIYALKSLGVEQLISVSAVGSLKEEIKPRDFVVPDQLFDRTRNRVSTFFTEGIVAHIPFANPYCKELSEVLYKVAEERGLSVKLGGTYVCIEGPQFSTRAESKVYRQLGFSIIGMTNIPEAKLAREAEICYSTIALVTDYDVWKEGEEVSVERVLENVKANVENVKGLIKAVIPLLQRERKCECSTALCGGIQTARDSIDKETAEKLKLLIGKYLS